jgi:hypothetical protein
MYRDAISRELVKVVERLNHCGVKVREIVGGREYVTCFCSLLAQ